MCGLLLVLAGLVVGCAADPYIQAEVPRPGLLRDANGVVVKNAWNEIQPQHVSVPVAREYARLLQDAYRRNAGQQSALRVGLDTTLLGAAAAAIAIAATGGRAETAGLIGISGGALGVAGSRWLNPVHRRIYFQGALALECVVAAATKNQQPNMEVFAITSSINSLNNAILRLEAAATGMESRLAVEPPAAQIAAAVRGRVALARFQAARLRQFATAAAAFADEAAPLGQILLSKTEEIRIRVDAEVAKSEPDLLGYNEGLQKVLQAVPSGGGGEVKAPAAAPAGPPTPQFSAALDGMSKAFRDAFRDLETAIDGATLAEAELLTSLKAFKSTDATRVPGNLFDGCALIERIGAGPMALSRAEQKLAAGSKAQLQARIAGGRQPYEVVPGLLPSGIAAKVIDQTADGATLDIDVAADALKTPGQVVVVAVRDSVGDTRNFVIRMEGTAKTSNAAGSAAAKSSAARPGGAPVRPVVARPLPAPPAVDDKIAQRIQDFLVTEHGKKNFKGLDDKPPLGPAGANGKWSPDTKKAVIAYFNEGDRFDRLKASLPELKDAKIGDLGNVPDDRLAKYMVHWIDNGL